MPKYKSTPEYLIQTAMHMACGLQHAIPDGDMVEEVANTVGGWVGLVAELEPHARYAEMLLEEHETDSFPGVHAYEVAQEFGAWFGKFCIEHKRAPTTAEASNQLAVMTALFFAQGIETAQEPPKRARIISSTLTVESTVYAVRVPLDSHPGAVDFDAEDFDHARRIADAIDSGFINVALRD